MKKGKFIVLEGIDGSGKSSQLKRLAERFDKEGILYYSTFEPTKNAIGSVLRSILTGQLKADEKTIAALFLADRMDHIQNENYGMLKYLEKGYHVICDRYYFSSFAYHCPEAPMDWVIAMNQECAKLLKPDLNIYIEMEPKDSLTRILARNEALEKYETLEKLELIRNNYLEAFSKLNTQEKIVKIDGNNNIETVGNLIWDVVATVL